MKEPFLPKAAGTLALAANAIFLVYLNVFACAQPSGPLVAAVAFEIVFFSAMIAYRFWRRKTQAAHEAESALQYLERHSRLIWASRNGLALTGVILSSAACLFLTVDLAALLFANCGNRYAAVKLYRLVAPPAVLDMHPAFSLEMLAGAYIQAGKFEKAEQLEFTLIDIRRAVVGEKHELMAAIYADLADLYKRMGKLSQAESCYRRAISLSKEIHYALGYGSPLTKLAVLLRDEQRFAQSEQAFQEALSVREKIFGGKSLKVADTLKEYSLLKLEQGHAEAASEMEKQAAEILNGKPKKPADRLSSLAPLVVLCLSFLIFSQRDRLLSLMAARLRAKDKMQAATVVVAPNAKSRFE